MLETAGCPSGGECFGEYFHTFGEWSVEIPHLFQGASWGYVLIFRKNFFSDEFGTGFVFLLAENKD